MEFRRCLNSQLYLSAYFDDPKCSFQVASYVLCHACLRYCTSDLEDINFLLENFGHCLGIEVGIVHEESLTCIVSFVG